jgi:hypothetical protein
MTTTSDSVPSGPRYAVLREVLTLDPLRDHQRIVYLVGSYDFPWDSIRALELALFRTFAVPSIAALLAQTGRFDQRGQRRYDDTSLLLAEIVEQGYDSDAGRAAIRRMNQLHRRFDISNDDYLYVLSTFVFELGRWNARFGWRPATRHEQLANFYFWREVGRRMNIQHLPDDYDAFAAFSRDYERRHYRQTTDTRQIAEATMNVFLAWLPPLPFVHAVARQAVYCLLDAPLREAFGYPAPHPLMAWAVDWGMGLRAALLRHLPPRRTPYRYTQTPNRTYPQGYQIEGLGE